MNIIIDTREQLPLTFTGHTTTRRKLNEGDYNTEDLLSSIVIERKSLQDLYGSIIQGHARFKREIERSKAKGKTFYLFLEGSLEEFYYLNWSKRNPQIKPSTLNKIINTMRERHGIIIIECKDRESMSRQIVEIIEQTRKNKRR